MTLLEIRERFRLAVERLVCGAPRTSTLPAGSDESRDLVTTLTTAEILAELKRRRTEASIQRRLYHAYQAVHQWRCDKALPDDLRAEFGAIQASLTKVPAAGPTESMLEATLRAMTEEESKEIAKKFLALADRVRDRVTGILAIETYRSGCATSWPA